MRQSLTDDEGMNSDVSVESKATNQSISSKVRPFMLVLCMMPFHCWVKIDPYIYDGTDLAKTSGKGSPEPDILLSTF